SRPGLPVAEQQAELLRILDVARELRLNAIVLQVRPAGDALYRSELEPWSEYLTGRMGVAPSPAWDPLAFAVEEAHRRGLELHAWFNPFRARYSGVSTPAASTHLSRTRPDLVMRYGPFVWMDPGQAAVRAHSLQVIKDVVRRYDIDGVHIDDYFYPYQERNRRGRLIPFPDDKSYARYRARGGTKSRADWRRANIDTFVQELYRVVKETKPHVKVGISPFGIWRPGYPESVSGLDAYAEIYADARKWLREGWLDYLAPQLYWRTEAPAQRYVTLLRWWVEQNEHDRHVWPGNAPFRVGGERGWPATEIVDQIRLTRAENGATGNLLFSMQSLLRNRAGIAETLARDAYSFDALVPPSPWLDSSPPEPPRITRESAAAGDPVLRLDSAPGDDTFVYAVRLRFGSEWFAEVLPGGSQRYSLQTNENGRLPDEIAVSAVDRAGLESQLVRLPLGGN
ncbi:MAG TPA: family 10 glycosylhydrolase, partial [Longimicrobiales bacterium]|nr:family 10 glycosylhydrolase [Longimicrobiales bacterium]